MKTIKISKEKYYAIANKGNSSLDQNHYTQIARETGSFGAPYPYSSAISLGPAIVIRELSRSLASVGNEKSLELIHGIGGWGMEISLLLAGGMAERAESAYKIYRYFRYICHKTNQLGLPFNVLLRESPPSSTPPRGPRPGRRILISEVASEAGVQWDKWCMSLYLWMPSRETLTSIGYNDGRSRAYRKRTEDSSSRRVRIKGTSNRDIDSEEIMSQTQWDQKWRSKARIWSRVESLGELLEVGASSDSIPVLLQELEAALSTDPIENYVASAYAVWDLIPILKKLGRIAPYEFTGTFIAGT